MKDDAVSYLMKKASGSSVSKYYEIIHKIGEYWSCNCCFPIVILGKPRDLGEHSREICSTTTYKYILEQHVLIQNLTIF